MKALLNKKEMSKYDYRRFSSITASLPPSFDVLKKRDFFDNDLFERNILLPKKDYLDRIYNKNMGTDKLLI